MDDDDNNDDDDTHPPRIIVRVGMVFRRGQKGRGKKGKDNRARRPGMNSRSSKIVETCDLVDVFFDALVGKNCI